MSTQLYFREQEDPTFFDEKDSMGLAQWLLELTDSQAYFDAALRSNLRGLHLLRRWQAGGEERLLELLRASLHVHDSDDAALIVDAVADADDEIQDARSNARTLQLQRTWIDPYRLLQSNNPQFPTLVLRGKGLGDDGAALLAAPLADNRSVRVLDLAQNGIGVHNPGGTLRLSASRRALEPSPGTIALANALRSNATLLRLDLSDNALSSAGAVALGDALRRGAALGCNDALRTLALRNNAIGERTEGPQALVLDIKSGSGAFLPAFEDGVELAKARDALGTPT